MDKSPQSPQGYVTVKCITRRPRWVDNLYGTGLTFEAGQSRSVPGHMARNFLRHPDVFEKTAEDAQDAAATEPQSDDTQAILDQSQKDAAAQRNEQNRLQDIYDRVNAMDKPGLLDFAKVNYRQELSSRKHETTLRAEVIGMIDQFGVV